MLICRKCGKEFPVHIKIDGKERNLQRRKFCFDCSPFGLHNTICLDKTKQTDIYVCEICGNEFDHGKGCCSYRKCQSCTMKQHRLAKKLKAVEYKGGKCSICGYSKCLNALCFHHLNPDEKDFGITAHSCRSWTSIKIELDKCILLCTNCHAEVHNGITKIPET